MVQFTEILEFWAAVGNDGWWRKNEALDAEIVKKYTGLHSQASNGDLDHWTSDANGTLALIIVLDQFSRNMFRGSPKAFAQDNQALEIAKKAITSNQHIESREDLRVFFYLPYEHSESIVDQKISVRLQHSISNNPEALKAALEHREIIQRFGRFPHRNAVLGRHTTPAEQAYLDGGGFQG